MNNKNNLIRRFQMIFAPNIPALYGQGLTDYEILVRIGGIIDECVDRINSFNELAEKLDAALTDLDTYTREEVKRIIEEMYNSGEIREIIDEVIAAYLDEYGTMPVNSQTLEARRLARFIHRRGDNDHNSNPGRRPYAVQSGTRFSYAGGEYIAYCLFSYGTVNSAVLQLRSANTYELRGQVKFMGGHVDCMDFNVNDGYFYIAPKNYENDGGGTNSTNDILRIKFADVIDSNVSYGDNFIDMPDLEDSGGVDKMNIFIPANRWYAEGVGYGSISCPANECAAGEFIAGQYEILYKFAFSSTPNENETRGPISDCLLSDDVIDEIENLRKSYATGWSWANVSVTTKYIYFLTAQVGTLIRVRRDTQRLDWIYNIPTRWNDGYYSVGEPEGLKVFDNGDCYIFTLSNMLAGGQVLSREQIEMTQLFFTNLMINTAPASGNIYHNNTTIIHVDSTGYENYFIQNPVYNPNGAAARPFANIIEAIDWAQSQLQFNNVIVYLHNTANPYFLSICSRASIDIRPFPNHSASYPHLANTGTVQPSLGGLYVYGGARVACRNINFWYSLNDVLTGNAYVTLRDCTAVFRDCTVQATQGGMGIKTAFYVDSAVVSMYYYAGSASTPATASYHDENGWTNGGSAAAEWKFIDARDSIINSHGLAATTGDILN